MIARILMVISLVLAAASMPAVAGERVKPMRLKELPRPLSAAIVQRLRDMGIKPNGSISYASASTENCPSNCNDTSGGGFCYCSPDSEGKCPSGTEKGGSPGDEYCKVRMPKAGGNTGEVFGGNLPRKITIEW